MCNGSVCNGAKGGLLLGPVTCKPDWKKRLKHGHSCYTHHAFIHQSFSKKKGLIMVEILLMFEGLRIDQHICSRRITSRNIVFYGVFSRLIGWSIWLISTAFYGLNNLLSTPFPFLIIHAPRLSDLRVMMASSAKACGDGQAQSLAASPGGAW